MSFNRDLLNSGINIVIYKNKVSQNLHLNTIHVKTSNGNYDKIINIDNDPNLKSFSVYVIKYKKKIESVSLALTENAATSSDAIIISTERVGQPILYPTSGYSKPTRGTMPGSIDEATNTSSYVFPEATTSKATTSETNSRKRSKPTPKGNVSKKPKQMVNETDAMLHDTFTMTGHFSILPEPVTNPVVPVIPNMDELPSDVLLDKDVPMFDNNRATSSPSVLSGISSDVMDYSSLNLDDNSNYSFALTEEEKFDSFIQDLL